MRHDRATADQGAQASVSRRAAAERGRRGRAGGRAGLRLGLGMGVVAAIALSAGVTGCSSSSVVERPMVGMLEPGAPLSETPRVTLAQPELDGLFTFGEPEVERGESGMSVRLPMTNAGPYRYGVSYRMYFYDAEGLLLETETTRERRVRRVAPGETRTLRGQTGAVEATAWRVHLDWAN